MGCCPSDEQVEHGVKESSGEGAFDLGLEEQRSSDRWVAVCAASMPGQAAHSARSVSSTYSENRTAELRCELGCLQGSATVHEVAKGGTRLSD